MKKIKADKEKTYICVICGKGAKAAKKIKCCGKEMITRKPGAFLHD